MKTCPTCGKEFRCAGDKNPKCSSLDSYNCTCYICDRIREYKYINSYLIHNQNKRCYKYQEQAILEKVLHDL